MANDGKVVIELVGKDSATQVFVKTFQDMQQAFHRLEGQNASLARSMAGTESSLSFLSGLPGLFLKIAGSIVSAYGAWNLFKKGLESADQFRVSTIGIGAALTNMAAPGQGSFEQLFQRNLDYAKQMYAAIEEEAAKHFAGPEDIMRGYNQLVQQGYNVRMEEVGALGLLVDKIKLATQGQNTEVQINQEIRALMEGQANAHSAIARELQTRLGPAWKDIVQQHKESGDLLQYLASLWPGISAATKEVQDTLTSQKTTLMGHLAFLGREGLGGAYDDIVGLMKEINGYLKEHGHELAGEIAAGWQDVKTLISEAYNFVYGIKEITKEAIRVEVQVFTTWVGDPIAQWFIKNHLPNLQKSDFGKSWNNFRNLPGGPGDPNHTDTGWINDFSGYEQPMPKDFWNARSGPPPKTIAPAHDDGGKGAKGAADDLQKELDKLRKEAETSRKDALDTLNESYRVVFEVGSSFAKLREDQIKLVQEATKETSTLWQAVMGDERLSYQERLSAANNYKDAHIKVIND
ncbi:MAG: hypothetical protein M1438_11650, partial [Deltaproteobacteria bacterium]|nr:hypothetical protein [Deltaproteobacteria bacterium]